MRMARSSLLSVNDDNAHPRKQAYSKDDEQICNNIEVEVVEIVSHQNTEDEAYSFEPRANDKA